MNPLVEGGVLNARGEWIALSHHPAQRPDGAPAAPLVVLCHGMLAHRGGKVRRIAEALQSRGLSALRFDHAGCGNSQGARDPITVDRRLDDLEAALAWALEGPSRGAEVAFGGSSMGAAVSLVAAARHGARAWAGIATPLDAWEGVRDAADGYGGDALVVWGDEDRVVPPSNSAWLVERWGARARSRCFPGGGHRLHEHVDEVAAELADFYLRVLRA